MIVLNHPFDSKTQISLFNVYFALIKNVTADVILHHIDD